MSKTIDIGLMGNQHINKIEEEQEMTKNKMIENLLNDKREELLKADASTLEKKNGICFDGIVDEQVFNTQKKKIMFLLKETNGNNSDGQAPEKYEDWPYQSWLQNKQSEKPKDNTDKETKFYSSTFNKLCMWVDVFYNCLDGKAMSFEEYEKKFFNEDNFRRTLKKTAIVNLKKTWGGGSTKWDSLENYLANKTVVEVLKKEISEIIEPDIVICGGAQVYYLAKQVFGGTEEKVYISDNEALTYFKIGKTVYMNFYHPACRKSRKSMYDFAVGRFNAIKGIL